MPRLPPLVFAARSVRWRGIFAVHTWIVVKEKGAPTYSRNDYTAWSKPIRTNGFATDGRWFSALPTTIVDGERLIPRTRYVIENYKFRTYGDYNACAGCIGLRSRMAGCSSADRDR